MAKSTENIALVSVLAGNCEGIVLVLGSLGFRYKPYKNVFNPYKADYEVVAGYLSYLRDEEKCSRGGVYYIFKPEIIPFDHKSYFETQRPVKSETVAFFFRQNKKQKDNALSWV